MQNDTPKYSTEEIRNGQLLFNGDCTFMLGVAGLNQLPPDNVLGEIAFAGRSNVGKSSLVNALTGRKTLAKTSNTPGRTQQLNYFNLADKLYMVDMPGYGFAQAPEALVKKWQKMIFAYLQGRVNLKRVFLLIDSRHGIKKVDTEIMEMLDKAAVNYQVVLTKSDKISAVALAKVMTETNKILKEHAAAHIDVIATSSEKGRGIDELRAEIARLAE
uniref:Probable GTP-binding protein EngB n=1 Tax=uncultured Alphaproteobacteria bacterium TaxID=91750 RepID=A0A6M4NQF3_9PROT|nr:putative GTP-binding protein EngB [uncultured Alphaproteobacteria bacterium]